MSLNNHERAALKHAISSVNRARILLEDLHAGLNGEFHCPDCGAERSAWTAGCRLCRQRHYARLKRGTYPGGVAAFRRDSARAEVAAENLASESFSVQNHMV